MSLKGKSIVLSHIILFVLVFFNMVWAAGEIDTTFNVAAYQLAGYNANPPMVAQPDGKVIIAFVDWGISNGIAAQGITRFNADGTVDTSFNAPRLASGSVAAFALQSNGKILVRGLFTVENSPYKNLMRLNTDGSIDTTFNPDIPPLPNEGYSIYVQPDDSFYTGSVYKFDANGYLDNSFNYQPYAGTVTNIAGLPDGKVYISATVPMSSGFDFLMRHNADGTRDSSYQGVNPNSYIRRMIVQPDGKLLIAGPFTSVNSTPVNGIARLNPDGTLDTTFNPGGAGVGGSSPLINDMIQLPDGKILIAGIFDSYNGVTQRRFARLNADGTLDTSFNYSGAFNNVSPGRLEVLSDGKIVASGSLFSTSQLPASFIKLNPDGSQIPEFFVQKASTPQRVRKTTVQSDGKIYVAGEFFYINGYKRNSLARLNPDGTVDASFVPFFSNMSGMLTIHQVLVQPDGKILVSTNGGFVITRLNPNGTRDTSFTSPFPSSSSIYDIALQADGKILVAGESAADGNPPIYARLNPNGSIDTTYNPPLPNDAVYRVLVQPDGKSIICGEFTQISTSNRGRIARYNTDGTLDNTFNPAGGADGNIYDIDLQPDGKIVVGGTFGTLNGSGGRVGIGRLNPDGSLDTSFAQTTDTIVQTVKVQPDGKILIGGLFANVGGVPREKLARLNADGSLDPTFNASADALVFDINLQADGKILVAGDFIKVNNVTKPSLVRLNNSAPPSKLFDYDGDGRADISVFRASENKWYILQSSNSAVTEKIFAIAGDIPVPADYDGDGKTDVAVFRPSTGDWWYLSSIDNAQVSARWGQAGDIPRPSDFDGDGKADYIVYRPSNNVWYRLGSTGATSILSFGTAGDLPLIGDFDGDGKTEPAIFRPSTGDWWYAASASGGQFLAVRWGQNGDIPAPADYDGDGKTDFAVYRPSNGVWYILRSSDLNFTILQFGLAEDKPVPADYDGDGKADIAVFRPSTGIWYLLQSTNGFGALQFGASGDIPTPNAFVP